MATPLIKVADSIKYDPWDAKQTIEEVRITVHCSRYWMLSEWECENMSFPFWRLYHSCTGGSFLIFNKKEYELTTDKLIVIPPNTSFSTFIKKKSLRNNESIVGRKITSTSEVEILKEKGMCDQLFVHFNLGYPFDKIKPDIYEIPVNDYWLELINSVKSNRLEQPGTIDIYSNFKINSLILIALQGIAADLWHFPLIDKRILKAISYIDKNIAGDLSNQQLSSISNLATNSFARLFRQTMKCPVQKFIQQRRIEHAIMTLHHSNKEIEEIALESGFYDRHHFSRVFKLITGISPAKYRSKIGM